MDHQGFSSMGDLPPPSTIASHHYHSKLRPLAMMDAEERPCATACTMGSTKETQADLDLAFQNAIANIVVEPLSDNDDIAEPAEKTLQPLRDMDTKELVALKARRYIEAARLRRTMAHA
jgi:hypothetical protein